MRPRLPASRTKEVFIEIKDFRGGTNTLISERRLDKKFATESVNLIQADDGIWKTRPGTNYYGQAIAGETSIDGATEFLKDDGTKELIAISGGVAYKSTDGGSWTEITGATFTAGERPFFLQIGGRLYIATGADTLAYYDGTELLTYAAILAPNAPTGTLTTLTSGSFANYYRIVAVNDIGFTEPSASLSKPTNKQRGTWTSTEKIALAWDAVAGANGYQVFWGEFDGQETFLTSVSTNSWDDDGSIVANPYVETPDDNTTGAPRFRSMEVSGNRIWATYDPDNEYRVYFSGTGQYVGFFSPFYGGGYIDLEKGGRNKPVSAVHFRTGKGDPIITVLCSSPDGYGTIFQIELTAATVGDTTFTVPAAYKVVGSIGGSAPFGVVKSSDNVLFLNKQGVFALRNKAQIFNVLSTDDLSAPIRDQLEGLNSLSIESSCGYYKPPVAYFSVPKGSTNDHTVLFDFERNNWNWAWNIGFKQFLEYTESSGFVRFLAVPTSGNRLVEISEMYSSDLGEAFSQSYISTLIPVSKDITDQAKIRNAVFTIGEFYGTVTCEVLGIGKDQNIVSIGSETKESANTLSTSGWGDDLFSDFLFSDTGDVPTTSTQPVTQINVKVNKKVYALQYHVYSNTANSSFKLLEIQSKGTLIPSRAPSSWN